ncbi:hypothetical protein [Geminicoccus roseus]|uniref:hypothetical protein n=1 Tax=Geminicoccus roseus TaxID=404900 RepID=UPI000415B374|nr:hypothetical protein [Geminicoccus roseus]
MNPFMTDADLLALASERLAMSGEALMQRYYGSLLDARHEMEEFQRTGRLQNSFATMLRTKLDLRSSEMTAPGLQPAVA